jgi:hypothetical protein
VLVTPGLRLIDPAIFQDLLLDYRNIINLVRFNLYM